MSPSPQLWFAGHARPMVGAIPGMASNEATQILEKVLFRGLDVTLTLTPCGVGFPFILNE